jgi:dihydroneopterin aldolase
MKQTDSIFINGLKLKARVGIYPAEKKKAQSLKLSCRIFYTRKKTDTIKDVISYETAILDIRKIISARHYDLIETLADTIIARIFKDKRIIRVEIDIEKPDLARVAPKVFGNTEGIGISVSRER